MDWRYKAIVMELCARLPFVGTNLYRYSQKLFGRLKADPLLGISAQKKMADRILAQNNHIVGKTLLEIGTGHAPIVPIVFFLSGAESIITIDLNRRLDIDITRTSLKWMLENRNMLAEMYAEIVKPSLWNERFHIIEQFWSDPDLFLSKANIQYLAPANAAKTKLSEKSIDYIFSISVLEHIPEEIICKIGIESKRILRDDGLIIHLIDLSDHFQHQDHSITKINFLRFSKKEWMQIANNEFAYCNRMRKSDYLAMFEKLRLDAVKIESELDNESIEALRKSFPLHKEFTHYDSEDLCTSLLYITLKKQFLS